MKKFTRYALGLVLGIALTFTSLNAAGYINWPASKQYGNSVQNLEKLEQVYLDTREENAELRSKQAEHEADVAYLVEREEVLTKAYSEQTKLVEQRDVTIRELQTAIVERDKQIEQLRIIIDTDGGKLNQAVIDMTDLDNRITNLLALVTE